MEIEVGDKLSSLFEKLGTQLGLTAEQIFPWYVQQMYFEGWVTITGIIITGLIFLTGLIVSFKKAKWEYNNSPADVGTIIFTFLMVIWLFVTSLSIGEAITQINNPKYHAMKAILHHIKGK